MAKIKPADQNQDPSNGSVTDQTGPAPLIPRTDKDNRDKASAAAYYEGRDQALTLLLKGEAIATSDWAQLVPRGYATKPGHANAVYELTPDGAKSLSNKNRAAILKINGVNHKQNETEFTKQAPEITAYLVQNKDVIVRILNEGIRAFQGSNPVDKAVAKPMHAALDRVKVGDMDSIAGLQFAIWKELQTPQYKENSAAQEVRVAAEGARKTFDERRDKYDQLVRVKSMMELAGNVLEGAKPYRSLTDADKKLLSVQVDGDAHPLIKRGVAKAELTEIGRDWAISIVERSTNLKSEATLLIDQSAKNSRDNARTLAQREQEQEKTPAHHTPSI
jgi:hypothetical protein